MDNKKLRRMGIFLQYFGFLLQTWAEEAEKTKDKKKAKKRRKKS